MRREDTLFRLEHLDAPSWTTVMTIRHAASTLTCSRLWWNLDNRITYVYDILSHQWKSIKILQLYNGFGFSLLYTFLYLTFVNVLFSMCKLKLSFIKDILEIFHFVDCVFSFCFWNFWWVLHRDYGVSRVSEYIHIFLSHDVAIIQWITRWHKPPANTCNSTFLDCKIVVISYKIYETRRMFVS